VRPLSVSAPTDWNSILPLAGRNPGVPECLLNFWDGPQHRWPAKSGDASRGRGKRAMPDRLLLFTALAVWEPVVDGGRVLQLGPVAVSAADVFRGILAPSRERLRAVR